MGVFFKFVSFLFFLSLFFSCSLKYGNNAQDESSVPEFVFSGVVFNRYEEGDKTLSLSSEKLERYKDGKSVYAKNLEFQLYDSEGEITNEGKCGYLSCDTDSEKYVLYDDIEINNKEDDLIVKAKNLKWNGKSEQLTSGRSDIVTIQKKDTILQGAGFSASAVSKTFSFSGIVSGTAQTSDKDDAENLETSETSEIQNDLEVE